MDAVELNKTYADTSFYQSLEFIRGTWRTRTLFNTDYVALFVLRQPKVIVSANCGIEVKKIIDYKTLLDQAIELSAWKPQTCIIYNRKHEQVW